MATPDLPIVRQAVEAAPKDYLLSGQQELSPLAVRAVLDGTAAAGSFLPALQLIAPGGEVMWTAVTSTPVAAGASADVSWFPRVGGGGGGGADPNAVHYAVHGESGTFLDVRTSTGAIQLNDNSGSGIYLTSSAGGGAGFVGISGEGGEVFLHGDPIVLRTDFRIEFQNQAGNLRLSFLQSGSSFQTLGPNARLEVDDRNGNPIFQVREDGSIHGLASEGAITWDL